MKSHTLRHAPCAPRPGFTLVELLVVIAIIAVFMAMMLPAVQASRETARRVECSNNLSQLMMAVHRYENAHEFYPAGVTAEHGPIHSTPEGSHQNWIVQLLPYMQELPAYKHVDKSAAVYAPENAAVRQLRLTLLQCPSDSPDTTEIGGSNYAGCHHDVEAPIDADNHGVFFLNSHLRQRDITDGPSHTIFIGEKLIDADDLGWMSGTRASMRNTGSALNMAVITIYPPGPPAEPEPAEPAATDATAPSEPPPADAAIAPAEPAATDVVPAKPPAGASEMPNKDRTTPAEVTEQTAAMEPFGIGTSEAAKADPTLYVGGFNSRHTGGVNFGFGDGTVKFILETIDQKILEQLGHRADGKLLNAPY
jgi:prepilin-type N-terminal cleavage/methylation domain-containing protein/prepilin-type processing-associated H-X9-DG protein